MQSQKAKAGATFVFPNSWSFSEVSRITCMRRSQYWLALAVAACEACSSNQPSASEMPLVHKLKIGASASAHILQLFLPAVVVKPAIVSIPIECCAAAGLSIVSGHSM